MNTAKVICESDEQGIVRIDVPVGRSRTRVEVLVVWQDLAEPDIDHPDIDQEEPAMADLVGLLQDVDLAPPHARQVSSATRGK